MPCTKCRTSGSARHDEHEGAEVFLLFDRATDAFARRNLPATQVILEADRPSAELFDQGRLF